MTAGTGPDAGTAAAARTPGEPAEPVDVEPAWTPPRWAWPVTLLLALIGLAISAYLTDAHYNESIVLACPDTGVVNCAKVTTSDESMILGVIPVAVTGLGYYLAVTIAMLPQLWRVTTPLVRWGRLALMVAGMGMVIWLVYAELFLIDAICLYCTAVHVITFLLFAAVAIATVWTPIDDDYDEDDYDDDELPEAGPA